MAAKTFRVLFVDEDSDSRIRMAIALERRGYKVTVAPSGNRAKICLRGQRYLAVVSEYKMNDGSGVELFDFIRAQQPKTCFIFFTSCNFDHETFHKYDTFAGVIDKARPEILFTLLRRRLAGVLSLK